MVEQACSPWSPLPLFLGNKPRVRSIRFGAGHDTQGSQSHVHFDEKLHDSVVMVTQESDSSFLVKVCTHLLLSSVLLSPPPPQSRLASWACLSIFSKLPSQAYLYPSLDPGSPICKVGSGEAAMR